ncbi:DUF4430 domain-containing protein [Streptomyces sp. 3MP-14]|uniref:DUF4430 domain-containing protein n=1 Tax=Streptomyces mimosae TaxID=2586635 RepID=A0A5N5ZXT7_9ACTN|nr:MULTISPECIES: DUF4430 domain-containing protein [Streptomyces]KAB8161324.1 DUF4430 domain-containing protein [Streptomyces mimosae]KAB8173126.1 DUF4430 domain-containing protein [Streptomyces sp. 3MP-14]
MSRLPFRSTTAHRRVLATTAALGLALLAAAPAAQAEGNVSAAAPITVSLTVTGPDGVLFDGDVSTDGHVVNPATGGAQLCDGTNNGANPSPGATPTGALDDAAAEHGFAWDGVWYPSFDDYLVTTIDGQSQTADDFWLISVNGTATPVGGCQFQLDAGDQVDFAWTPIG